MKKSATKSSKKPSSKRQQIIVLVDSAGNYYELPRATLERSRVSNRRKEKVKRALEDVLEESGYINDPVIPGSIVTNPVVGSQVLRYAGFYLGSTKSKR
jgi:hypothetical protein